MRCKKAKTSPTATNQFHSRRQSKNVFTLLVRVRERPNDLMCFYRMVGWLVGDDMLMGTAVMA